MWYLGCVQPSKRTSFGWQHWYVPSQFSPHRSCTRFGEKPSLQVAASLKIRGAQQSLPTLEHLLAS